MGLEASSPKINHLGQVMTSPMMDEWGARGCPNGKDFPDNSKKKPHIAAGLFEAWS
jgi:hypothetical protein